MTTSSVLLKLRTHLSETCPIPKSHLRSPWPSQDLLAFSSLCHFRLLLAMKMISLESLKKKNYDVRKIENPFLLLCSKIIPSSFVSNQSAYKICRLWSFSSADPGSCSQGPKPKNLRGTLHKPYPGDPHRSAVGNPGLL